MLNCPCDDIRWTHFAENSLINFPTAEADCSHGNLYSVLGVSPAARSAAIKAAYYSLAKQYHPDTHAGEAAQQRIREINDAYRVLSDLGARTVYDLLLERQRAATQTRFWRGVAAGAVAFALTIGSVPLLVLWQQSRTVHQEITAPAGAAVKHHAQGSEISATEPEDAAAHLALGNGSHNESALSVPLSAFSSATATEHTGYASVDKARADCEAG